MAHHGHPPQTLVEEIDRRLEIRHCFDGIGQKLHFIALLGNQPPEEQIICRAILNRLIASEAGDARAGRYHRLPKGELHTVELPGDQKPRIKIRNHANGLKMLNEIGFFD